MNKEINKILIAGTEYDIRDSRFDEASEAETARQTAETARQEAETARQEAERGRATAEQQRAEAEAARAEEFAGFEGKIAAKEDAANKVTAIGADADDQHYPSAKAVWSAIVPTQEKVAELEKKMDGEHSFVDYILESGTFTASGDASTNKAARITNDKKTEARPFTISVNEGYKIARVEFYNDEGIKQDYFSFTTDIFSMVVDGKTLTNTRLLPISHYRIAFYRLDGAAITEADMASIIKDFEYLDGERGIIDDVKELKEIVDGKQNNLSAGNNIFINNDTISSKRDMGGIYVAAVDSSEKDKTNADYVCSGTNDQVTLQNALEELGSNGTLHLAVGNYNVHAFNTPDDGGQPYVLKVGDISKGRCRIKIACDGQVPARKGTFSISNCAVINIKPSCYSALDSDKEYSIIRCAAAKDADGSAMTAFPYNILNIEGIGIKVLGNQKKIIGIDGLYASSMIIKNCMLNALATDSPDASTMTNAVVGCIGVRCTQGSNFGIGNRLDTCACYGFHTGFAISGEHYVLCDCKTRFNDYGYTFNNYDVTGSLVHPNTLINCTSEFDFNFPYFGNNPSFQPITFIDFNMEYKSDYFAKGGNLAREQVIGSWRGNIGYTIKGYAGDTYKDIAISSGKNLDFIPFWESGNGGNISSHNDIHKQKVTTEERLSYGANEMQRVYDTTLGQFFMYVNGNWIVV